MSFSDKFGEAWANVCRTHAENRLAHAYVIVGAPRGDGLAFAEALTQLILCTSKKAPCNTCDNCERVRKHTHPDVILLEPESKSRVIVIDEMRPFLQRLSQTSYLGGWKAGIVLFADRLNDSSGNAFLKTLEEPPPRTLLLLVTDQQQSMLTTLRSRCQTIVLSTADVQSEGAWREPLLEMLRQGCGAGRIDRLAFSAGLRRLLDQVRTEIEDRQEQEGEEAPGDDAPGAVSDEPDEDVLKARVQSEVLRIRADMLRVAMLWYRDVMACATGSQDDVLQFPGDVATLRAQAERLGPAAAHANAQLVEELQRRINRIVVDSPALDRFALDLKAR